MGGIFVKIGFLRCLNKKSKKETDVVTTISNLAGEDGDDEYICGMRKGVCDRVASDGINPNPLEYMEIKDGSKKSYVTVFYINVMPKKTVFAQTLAPLFNMQGVTSNVYVEPISPAKTRKLLNKRISNWNIY